MRATQAGGEELAYALVTPYSLHKSRTGGILARLLWADVKLVAARMYAPRPGSGFIEEYCDAIWDPAERCVPLRYQKRLIDYVIRNFSKPNVHGISNRLLLLVFCGPNARRDIMEAVGGISQPVRGDNVRGTFGDAVGGSARALDRDPGFAGLRQLRARYGLLGTDESSVHGNGFFEPAVLTGAGPEMHDRHLKLFCKRAYQDGGFVLEALDGMDGPDVETSMVILKPESLRHRNPLVGNLIDFFARTGMSITAAKMMEMSVEQAREFYALKIPQFRRTLRGMVGQKARQIVSRSRGMGEEAARRFGGDCACALTPANALALARKAEELFACEPAPGQIKPPVVARIFEELGRRLHDLDPPDSFYDELCEDLKDLNAETEFNELIKYMTGKDPTSGLALVEGEETRCMALLYSGKNALTAIRKRLKELRAVYGQNILVNRAHASDPDEDPTKEVEVLGMPNAPQGESRPCDVQRVVDEFYGPDQGGEPS
jgi:nucleoside diphosphate kinase